MSACHTTIGQRIHTNVLAGQRAEYGEEIIATLSQQLMRECRPISCGSVSGPGVPVFEITECDFKPGRHSPHTPLREPLRSQFVTLSFRIGWPKLSCAFDPE